MEENVDLTIYNTFGICVKSRYLQIVSNIQEMIDVVKYVKNERLDVLILGCGSNVLLTRDWEGMTIVNRIKGITLIKEDVDSYYVKVGAGEIWNEFVNHCVEMQMGGVENLALIPGTVGAAPIQNIGAYDAELADVFDSLEAMDTETLEIKVFNKRECEFGYRDSVFKRKLKGNFVIVTVTFKLSKVPKFITSYGTLASELDRIGISELSLKSVSDAVKAIRKSKLPDPEDIGNAGSFFKNPIISKSHFELLKSVHPGITGFQFGGGMKVSAGWLMEQAGWKGMRRNNCGVHDKQALVLVNYGRATGEEIYSLALMIVEDVMDKFGVHMEPEVNVVKSNSRTRHW